MRLPTEARNLSAGLDEDIVSRGRAALESYVLDVLFNPANREGSRFRGECLAWRDTDGRRSLKDELLTAAATWSPDSDWERSEDPSGVTYSGRMSEFYTTIRFAGANDPVISVEVD